MGDVLEIFTVLLSDFQILSYCYWKCKFYRPCLRNPASGWLQIGHKLEKRQWHHNLSTQRHRQFFWRCRVSLSSLVTDPSFRSISSLFLKLWQFSFARDWPEIRKLEILPSEFCSISGDWVELGIPNLAQMFLIKSYWMLQNSKVTAFTVWVIKGKPTGKVKLPLRTHTHTPR